MDLPMDNEDMLPKLLYERISEINRTQIGARQLTSILERFLPVYSTIHQALTSHIFVDGFPISSNRQKTVDLLIAITKEFSISYYFILNAYEAKKIPWLPAKIRLILVDDSNSTFLRHGYGQFRFGHRIHDCGDEG